LFFYFNAASGRAGGIMEPASLGKILKKNFSMSCHLLMVQSWPQVKASSVKNYQMHYK
jgi:hypothetical protein